MSSKKFTLSQAKSIYFDQIGGDEYSEKEFEELFDELKDEFSPDDLESIIVDLACGRSLDSAMQRLDW